MDISTSRLYLVALKEADFYDIHVMNSVPEVAQYNTIGIPNDFSVTEKMLQEVLANEKALVWILRRKEDHGFIGEVGLNLASERFKKGEIYYSLHPDFWGMGYATEAVQAIVNHGFNDLHLHRIEAGVAVTNLRSIKLLEKIGMTREGLCRKILPLQTGWTDNYMYAILEEDTRDY